MPTSTAARFAKLVPEILKQWEQRAKMQVLSALDLESLTLRDSLPKLMQQIVHYLETIKNHDAIRARQDKKDGIDIGKEHGCERAELTSYTMDQMILEYHILRQVVFDVVLQEIVLSELEREILLCAIEQAVNSAATEFNSKMRVMQQQLAQRFTHDLRGPLTAVRMSAERITKFTKKPERVEHQASRVISGIDRLDQMVEDLLDSSLVQSGQPLALQYRSCDLQLIAQEVIDAAHDAYGDRFILKCEPAMVGRWSEQSVYRILQNLVTNAVKYGAPKKPITVTVARREQGAHLEVHNHGAPIAEKNWDILFEPYQQGQTGERRGYGLGLSVVKGLAESHGGGVAVKSSMQAGTTFSIDIISEAGAEACPATSQTESASSK